MAPPGPLLQKWNAALHQDPVRIIAYGLVWSTLLMFVTPIAVFVLQCQMLLRLYRWWSRTDGKETYSPKNQTELELAVFITGCDSGFGKELALWAAQAGYTVFAACLKSESMTQFQSEKSIIPLLVDVCQNSDVNAAVESVQSWLNPKQSDEPPPPEVTGGGGGARRRRVLHAVVNNAGIGVAGEIDWLNVEEYETIMNVNFFGMLRCCKAFLPLLKEQSLSGQHKEARIVNLTSIAGMLPSLVGLSAYGASKQAATLVSNSLRIELAPFGIQVVTVCPGFHSTPLANSMSSLFDQTWKGLPPATRDEYGEEYYQRYLKLAVDVPQSSMWNAGVVVDEMFKCLTCQKVPGTVIVGSDAAYAGVLLRWLPCWFFDLFWTYVLARPIPAAVTKSRK